MRSAQLVSTALLFSSLSAAWSWQDSWDNQVLDFASLGRRAETSATDTFAAVTLGNTDATSANPTDSISAAAATSDASSSNANAPTATEDGSTTTDASSAAATSGGSSAATTTASGSNSKGTSSGAKSTGKTSGGSSTTSSSSTTTAIDPRLPAGGISMITPNALSSSSYYKIGNYVTFAWNYTSLSVTPSAVDILASCSANDYTYTLALNQSITAATQAITWDTGAYQETATIPLLTETYTLIVYDAASSISATAQAGYLAVYDQFTFGMYTPQPYTPLADYVCATCSGAMSTMERQTLGFLFGMAGIAIASFTIFAGGAGVF